MLAATLKGALVMGLMAGTISQPAPGETGDKVVEAEQVRPLHYLLETEISQPDEIILMWM